jgi:hypothetical protein
LRCEDFDCLITDLVMPGASGLDVARQARDRHADIALIGSTGRGTFDDGVEALRLGFADILKKPFDVREIQRAVCYRRVADLIGQLPRDFDAVFRPRLQKYYDLAHAFGAKAMMAVRAANAQIVFGRRVMGGFSFPKRTYDMDPVGFSQSAVCAPGDSEKRVGGGIAHKRESGTGAPFRGRTRGGFSSERWASPEPFSGYRWRSRP